MRSVCAGRLVVDDPSAAAQRRRLLRERKIVLLIDHRFALSNPALPGAFSKKSFSKGQLCDLSVQRLDAGHGRRRFAAGHGAEDIGSPGLQLLLLRCYLTDVPIELISQLCNRPLALEGS